MDQRYTRRPSSLLVPPETREPRPRHCDLVGGGIMMGASCEVDGAAASRLFYLRGRGTVGATPAADDIGKSLAWYGDAAITAAFAKWTDYGSSVGFDGSGDYVDVSGVSAIGTGAFTVRAWVYLTASPSSSLSVRYITYAQGGTNPLYFGIYGPSRHGYAGIGTGYIEGGVSIPLNAWTLLEASCAGSGSTLRLFVGGAPDGTATTTYNSTSTTYRIGRGNSDDQAGGMSDVGLYGSELHTSGFTPPTLPPC